jgi:hypothetical protein
MVIGPTGHPDREKLCAFGAGRLAPAEAADVEGHLAGCDYCCWVLEENPVDTFVTRLRLARPLLTMDAEGYGLGAPNGSLEGDTTLDGGACPDGDIPPELALHPRYRVLRLLGKGGMGTVYLAEHRRMGRPVALKVIDPSLLRHAGALPRFQQEVRAAARLDHANIVAAYDADQAGGLHFLVMEYVEGRNLADHLAETGPLPVAEACDAARQAALGLQHAHERGMVHRDIKPHNLMRVPSGQVKVLDFGLARFAAEPPGAPAGDRTHASPHLTGSGAVMGTADYIAPEQARDAHGADARADVYSLGCTLYHLLAGRPPFAGGTAAEKVCRHASEEPAELRALRPGVPEGLAAVLGRMMAKKPEDRYPTAAAAAEALRPYADAAGRAKKGRRRRTAWVVLLALAALLTAAASTAVVRLSAGNDREIVIETDDPELEVVARGDRLVRIVDPKTGRAYQLDRADLTLAPADDPDGLRVTLDGERPVVLRRQGKRIAVGSLCPSATAGRAFREAHGLDERAFREWLDRQGAAGFRPEFLSVQAGADVPLFNGVAVPDSPAVPTRWRLGLSGAEPGEYFFESVSAGYRPLVSCVYDNGGEQRQAHLYIKDGVKYGGYGVDRASAGRVLEEQGRKRGFLPIYLSTVEPPGPDQVTMILAPGRGAAWQGSFDLTADALRDLAGRHRANGWRPVTLNAYKADGRTRLLAVFAENPDGIEWDCRVGLSVAEYEESLKTQDGLGLRPTAVASAREGDGVRYTAVWERYRVREAIRSPEAQAAGPSP